MKRKADPGPAPALAGGGTRLEPDGQPQGLPKEAQAILDTVHATGGTFLEALGMIKAAGLLAQGVEPYVQQAADWLRKQALEVVGQNGWHDLSGLPEAIGSLSRVHLPLARMALQRLKGLDIPCSMEFNGCMEAHGETALLNDLPEGLRVEGVLSFQNCHDLKKLPEGLVVGEVLYLDNCRSFQRLPERFEILGLEKEGSDDIVLSVQGCREWDKRIPPGMKFPPESLLEVEDNSSTNKNDGLVRKILRRTLPKDEAKPDERAILRVLLATGAPMDEIREHLLAPRIAEAQERAMQAYLDAFSGEGRNAVHWFRELSALVEDVSLAWAFLRAPGRPLDRLEDVIHQDGVIEVMVLEWMNFDQTSPVGYVPSFWEKCLDPMIQAVRRWYGPETPGATAVDRSNGGLFLRDALEILLQADPRLAERLLDACANLEVRDSLMLTSMQQNLKRLPEGIRVANVLDVRGSSSLESLPKGLKTGGGIYANGCGSLRELPEGLEVGGDLVLDLCKSLRTLPKGLKVKGSLIMSGCPNWDGTIPEDAEIGGVIFSEDFWDGAAEHGLTLAEWRERNPRRKEIIERWAVP